VRDFEGDQNLDCAYAGGIPLFTGLSVMGSGYRVDATIEANNSSYVRRYKLTTAGTVTSARLPDLDPSKNPSSALPQPISEEAAHDVAEAFAQRLFADYDQVTWNWTVRQRSSDLVAFYIDQQLANGAITDRQVSLKVSLGSGEVTDWLAQVYSLPQAASASPALSLGEARDAAEAVYSGLDGLTPTHEGLRYYADKGLVYQFEYIFNPAQKPSNTPTCVWVDAQTGDIAWLDFFAGSATPPIEAPASDLINLLTGVLEYVLKAVASLF
jgi:hypothetical protein